MADNCAADTAKTVHFCSRQN